MNKQEWCLVLGGGGAKGAYQIGAWKALRELDFHFNCIIGTSVGSLNGALIAQNSFDEAVDLWENISVDKVINIPEELVIDGRFSLAKTNLQTLRKIRRTVVKNGGFDTGPLRNLVGDLLSEDKIKKSRIDFGIVTYRVNNLKPVEIYVDQIKPGMLIDYLLGSATFPGFKATEIEGKVYIDGGVYDNLPFSVAKDRGYKNIIIVDVSGLGVNRKPDVEGRRVVYIKNSVDLGNILDFNAEQSKKNLLAGYYDTLKIFDKVDGIRYFYKKNDKTIADLKKILCSDEVIEDIKSCFDKNSLSSDNLETSIRELLPKDFCKYREIILPLIESAASLFNLERVKLYDFKEIIGIIYKSFEDLINSQIRESDSNDFKDFFNKVKQLNFFDFFNDKTKHNLVLNFLLDDNYIFHIRNLNALFDNLLIPTRILYFVLKRYNNRL